MNWIVLAAFGIVGCTASPQSAQTAGPERVVREGEINLSNIDTSSEVGADRLLRRILSAAVANCRIEAARRMREGATPIRACLQASMTRDVARVKGRVVSARFSRTGATMIEAAARDFASADRPEPVAVIPLVIDNLPPVFAIRARPEITTDELNRRESARLRAVISSN